MTTKTTTLRAIDLITGLSNDRDGVPFRWLASMVEKVRAQVPDDEEGSCLVHGAGGLTFTFEHTLTVTEKLQADLDAMRATAAQIKALLPRAGALDAEATDELRELLR